MVREDAERLRTPLADFFSLLLACGPIGPAANHTQLLSLRPIDRVGDEE